MRRRYLASASFLAGVPLAAVLGCSSAAPVSSAAPRVTASCPAAKPVPAAPSLQLAARSSIGTGTLARAWARGILTALGAPGNSADVSSLVSWFAAEDDRHAAGTFTYGAGENNPLNLTADSGDTVGIIGSEPSGAGPGHPGNIDFRAPSYGIAATAQVIESRYPAIRQALQHGTGLIGNSAVSAALSEWSGGGYSKL